MCRSRRVREVGGERRGREWRSDGSLHRMAAVQYNAEEEKDEGDGKRRRVEEESPSSNVDEHPVIPSSNHPSLPLPSSVTL